MSKEKNDTLYDKWMRQLKNNPFVVAILVIGAIAVGVTQGLDTFNTLKNTLSPPKVRITEISVNIQPYKLTQSSEGSPTSFTLTPENTFDINTVAGAIIDQITGIIQPGKEPVYQTILKIDGNRLYSDKSLNGYLVLEVANSVLQGPTRIPIDEDLLNGGDLQVWFEDAAFFSYDCSCINLEIDSPITGYKTQLISIFRHQDNYSFHNKVQVVTKDIDLPIVPVILLLLPPEGEGPSESDIKIMEISIDNKLRQQIRSNQRIALSPFKTQDELAMVTATEMASIPIGQGKQVYLEKNRVDYIIMVTFIMK